MSERKRREDKHIGQWVRISVVFQPATDDAHEDEFWGIKREISKKVGIDEVRVSVNVGHGRGIVWFQWTVDLDKTKVSRALSRLKDARYVRSIQFRNNR